MLSIKNNVLSSTTLKKSKFITCLFRVDSVSSVNSILYDLRKKYNDATHICYAYIIDSVKKFSDDGEPSGTAGMPILSVLENNNLDHILCCVVRYFGGIKLGSNGLVRAYSNSTISAINEANIINYVKGYIYQITFNYNDSKLIDNLLKDAIITNKKYDSLVSYTFKCSNINCSILSNYGTLVLIGECYIEQ